MAFSVLTLRAFLEAAERLQLCRDDLLAGIIADAALERDDLWVSNSQFYDVLERAFRITKDAALGLHIGERSTFTAFDAVGLLLSVVPTFRDAVTDMARFHDVARDEQDIFVTSDSQTLVVEYRLFDAAGAVRRCLAEIVLASLAVLLRQFAGARGVPRAIELDYGPPEYALEYVRVFQCDASFDRERVALVVDREIAERKQLLSQPGVALDLRRRAESRQLLRLSPRTLVGRVRHELREAWQSGAPSMDVVARQLGMSQRSLHRHLAREGFDYRTILNEARCEAAAHLLRGRGLAVKAVARELGFSTSASFYRAFKRWMGCSPSDYAAGRW